MPFKSQKECEVDKIFKEIILAENFSNLVKDINLQIQEIKKTQS